MRPSGRYDPLRPIVEARFDGPQPLFELAEAVFDQFACFVGFVIFRQRIVLDR
jgi:hypothetical protein